MGQACFSQVNVRLVPEIVPYREAFRAQDLNPNRIPFSAEAMFSRISRGKDMPRINPLVDLNNALSLNYVIPMGTQDLGCSSEDIDMRYALPGDIFVPFGGEGTETPDPGEIVYVAGHEVRTRRWTWRQSEYGKITADTSHVFFPIDGFTDVNQEQVDPIRAELAEHLQGMFHCQVITGFVDRDHPICNLDM